MILKASQRGGAKQLGLHLLKTVENEHVEVHELRGFVSDDIVGALKEAYAVSRGTRCKQFLFSVSLNPPETESVGIEVFEDAARRIEEKVGLSGHPRVIVFHEKEGRRHAHAVWSRIDADSMTAVNLSHFKVKLRDISRELYMENEWKMPRGLMNSAERDPRNYSLVEYQQAKRMGRNARDLKAMMQECWAVSDSRAAFTQALKERGLVLAKGDRRGHVAVTHEGEALSIARYVGKKARDVRAKLGEPDTLPSIDDAKARISQDMSATFKRLMREAETKNRQDRKPLEARRRAMTTEHRVERQKLDAGQQERWAREQRARQDRFNTGMRGLWDRLTGKHAGLRKQNESEAYTAFNRDRQQRQSVIGAQLEERRDLQSQIREKQIRQTELLQELRREWQTYRELAPEPPEIEQQLKSIASPVRGQFEHAASPSVQNNTPTPGDRLQYLRDGESGPSQEIDKGHEPER